MQMPVNRQSETPMGVYQVWHRSGDHYDQVGILKVGSLKAAADATMNRDPERWTDPDDGLAPATRRTMAGDVIVSPTDGAFRIEATQHGIAFQQTSLWGLQKLLKEIEENREEVQVGIEDGLKAGGRFADILRDASAYGVEPEEVAGIAESVRQEQGQEMER